MIMITFINSKLSIIFEIKDIANISNKGTFNINGYASIIMDII